jgi:hypothetical protein
VTSLSIEEPTQVRDMAHEWDQRESPGESDVGRRIPESSGRLISQFVLLRAEGRLQIGACDAANEFQPQARLLFARLERILQANFELLDQLTALDDES